MAPQAVQVRQPRGGPRDAQENRVRSRPHGPNEGQSAAARSAHPHQGPGSQPSGATLQSRLGRCTWEGNIPNRRLKSALN